MEEKITYLIGAGASANAHKLARTKEDPYLYANRIIEFVNELYLKFPGDYFGNLKTIAKNCLEFGSPDTYAKYLYERESNNDNYRQLKVLLSYYFDTSEFSPQRVQSINQRSIEPRVLPFLTYIAKEKKIADNVKVVSWNYDRQFEIAADKFRLLNPTNDTFPGFTVWPNLGDGNKFEKLPFLIHLNGLAGFEYDKNGIDSVKRIPRDKDWVYDFNTKEPLISYAWESEKDDPHNLFLSKKELLAQDMVKGTTILVVIGYSFPFFNRSTDNLLFKAMEGSLKKIYFQDFNNGEFLYNQFNLARQFTTYKDGMYSNSLNRIPIEIVHIDDLRNYYVPFEL